MDKNETSEIRKSTISDLSCMLKDFVHWVDSDKIKHNNRCAKTCISFKILFHYLIVLK